MFTHGGDTLTPPTSERERKDMGQFKPLLQERSNGDERVVTSRHKLAKNVEERAGECEKQAEDERWSRQTSVSIGIFEEMRGQSGHMGAMPEFSEVMRVRAVGKARGGRRPQRR
ncbi:hypothetical protein B0H13DRAFT_1880242 [Mycena leptocephala]|nr:hypothetical protein B0H13DRAFT_1880242 [Mycena leptocephala]